MTPDKIQINRAPVLTLWVAVVAERLGFNDDEALSLGKALAGLNAQSKGRRLGIFKPTPRELKKVRERERGEKFWMQVSPTKVQRNAFTFKLRNSIRYPSPSRATRPCGIPQSSN